MIREAVNKKSLTFIKPPLKDRLESIPVPVLLIAQEGISLEELLAVYHTLVLKHCQAKKLPRIRVCSSHLIDIFISL